MTSKNLFFKLMKENLKIRIWTAALSMVLFFFAMPVYCSILLEASMMRLTAGITTMEDIILYFKYGLTSSGSTIITVTVVIALVSALHGFGYLFSRSRTDLYHGIPAKRSQLFWPVYVNGLILYIVPYLVNLILALIVGAVYGVATPGTAAACLGYAGIHLIGYILLYSTVIVAVDMTGSVIVSILAAVVFAAYFPAVNSLIYNLFSSYFVTFYSGAQNDAFTFLYYLSPFTIYTEPFSKADWMPLSFGLIVVLAAAACLMTAAALILYRIRPSEAAGKAMAFKRTKPFIKVLLMVPTTLFCVQLFQMVSDRNKNGWTLFALAAGLILSHCVIEIIYESDFRAALRNPVTLAVSAALSAVILCIFRLDLFHYDDYLPDVANLESISLAPVHLDNNLSYFNIDDSGYPAYMDNTIYRLENMSLQNFEPLVELARHGIVCSKQYDKNNSYGEKATVLTNDASSGKAVAGVYEDSIAYDEKSTGRIVYCFDLKNGEKKYRSYYIDYKAQAGLLNAFYTDPEYKKGIFPILELPNDQIRGLRFKNALGYSEFIRNRSGETDALLETYREELLSLDIPTLMTEIPVCSILVQTSEIADASLSRNYGYDFGYTEYYVYPSFSKTISLLQEMGYPSDEKLNPSMIAQIVVRNYNYGQSMSPADRLAAGAAAASEDGGSGTAVYKTPAQIESIFSKVYPAEYSYTNSIFSQPDDLDVTVHYKGETSSGYTSNFSFVFINGDIPEFVKKDVKYKGMPYKDIP